MVYFSCVNTFTRPRPIKAPRIWAAINLRTHSGAIPANESEKIRPTVTAGFAKEVELVKKYALPIHEATITGINAVFS